MVFSNIHFFSLSLLSSLCVLSHFPPVCVCGGGVIMHAMVCMWRSEDMFSPVSSMLAHPQLPQNSTVSISCLTRGTVRCSFQLPAFHGFWDLHLRVPCVFSNFSPNESTSWPTEPCSKWLDLWHNLHRYALQKYLCMPFAYTCVN